LTARVDVSVFSVAIPAAGSRDRTLTMQGFTDALAMRIDARDPATALRND
jgi:hypothetical protein